MAVLEAGMGGGSDATAAIPGPLTVITPIDLDHCQWLGNSLQEIATEKVAIARPGSLVASAPQPVKAMSAIKEYCIKNGCSLAVSAPSVSGLKLGIPGSYQKGNASLALTAMELLAKAGFSSTNQQREAGLAKACWPGRMELFRLPDGREILLDGAHNPAGASALADAIAEEYPNRRIILLLGMMEDKEASQIVDRLSRLPELVITVQPDQERALSSVALAAICRKSGVAVIESGSVADGLSTAIQSAGEQQLIVLAGSLFAVGEARAILTDKTCEAVRG
jgi:dihydrofolate synthase/folylpolyglutamate synthase